MTTTATLTGFKPTGHLQLGNLLGAIQPVVAAQRRTRPVAFVADLHAMTVPHDPAELRQLTFEVATLLLAAGVDPDRSLFYAQSQVPEHAELHYLLECATRYGEAHRMIQFKERSSGRGARLSLLTYPVLMAADILLHGTAEVPVGEDQRQHVELARDVAARFNTHYGQTFVVPRAVKPEVAARIMDLSDPSAKMSKTSGAPGTIFLLDPPELIERKVMRAVTDSGDTVSYEPETRPGVANLLEILAGCAGGSPAALAPGYPSYGALKRAVAEAVVATVRPIQIRFGELSRDPGYVRGVLADGAERAREVTAETVHRARRALGLIA